MRRLLAGVRGWSLRRQVLVLVLVTCALVVGVTGVAAAGILRGQLQNRVDSQLAQAVQQPVGGRPLPLGRSDRHFRAPRAYVFGVYDSSGALLFGDDAGSQRPPPRLPDLGDPAVVDALAGHPVTVPAVSGGGQWRLLLRRDGDGDGDLVLAALPLDDVRDTTDRLLLIDGAVGLLALLVAGLLATLAVRRSLRPLADVEQTAHAIAAGDLDRRVPAQAPGTEVAGLAESFNVMVERFQEAYSAQQRSESQARASEERMRRFVGDASHELRTPLTSIRGFAELFRQGAVRDPAQLADLLRRIEQEAQRMGLLVEDLLLLARLDQQRPLRREPVDLLTVAADVVHAASAAHGASHDVTLLAPFGRRAPTVLGDEARLHQVLANLVTNAVVHTPPGSTVQVQLATESATVRLRVHDDGPGMAPDVAARVFERFYRADSARSRQGGGGTGLGLSIVSAIVAAHGGQVQVASLPGQGTTITVVLPAADLPAPPPPAGSGAAGGRTASAGR